MDKNDFWYFVFYKMDYIQAILDIFTFGIYGGIKQIKDLIKNE